MMEASSFKVSNLACRRGGRLLFKGLNFKLSSGDALLVTGRNGVGKTSLLRLLSALAKAEEGDLILNGVDQKEDGEAYQSHLAYLGHRNALKPALSVAENIGFWAGLRGKKDIDDALSALSISFLKDTPVRLLSSGQKRRTALARLKACGTSLWLLDEPSTGLDHSSRQKLDDMIAHHRNLGGMVIAVAHGDLVMPDAKDLKLEDWAL